MTRRGIGGRQIYPAARVESNGPLAATCRPPLKTERGRISIDHDYQESCRGQAVLESAYPNSESSTPEQVTWIPEAHSTSPAWYSQPQNETFVPTNPGPPNYQMNPP